MIKVLNENKKRAIIDVPKEFVNFFKMANVKKIKYTDEFSDSELKAIRRDVASSKKKNDFVPFDTLAKSYGVKI